MQNFREFQAGPDPFGTLWLVQFKWLQTAISIRHSDSVDVKFVISPPRTSDGQASEKTISIQHRDLLELAAKMNVPMTDPWCSRLAMLHMSYLIRSGEDMEKDLVSVSAKELANYAEQIRDWEREEIHKKRGAA